MDIAKTQDGDSLTFALTGRLDTSTSPELEQALADSLEGCHTLVFDFAGLDYLSSAGLRVLLSAQKRMNKQGTMTVRNVAAPIMEVFEMTGFSDVLTIE